MESPERERERAKRDHIIKTKCVARRVVPPRMFAMKKNSRRHVSRLPNKAISRDGEFCRCDALALVVSSKQHPFYAHDARSIVLLWRTTAALVTVAVVVVSTLSL